MRVIVRALGFAPDTADVEFEANLTVVRDFLLAEEAVELAGVRVTGEAPAVGSAAIRDFEERRRRGIGRFLDRSQISRFDNNRTGSLLRTVAGVDVKVGGSKAWVSGGRALGSGRGAFSQVRKEDVLDRQDIAAGAPLACYMDVYVDVRWCTTPRCSRTAGLRRRARCSMSTRSLLRRSRRSRSTPEVPRSPRSTTRQAEAAACC